MGKEGVYLVRALVLKAVRNVYERASGNGEIVNNYAVLALNVADYFKYLGVFVVPHAHLVANGNGAAQFVRHGARALCAARIRGNNDYIVHLVRRNYAGMARVGRKQRLSIKMVNGLGEEALHLRRVKIHCKHAVGARFFQHVRAYAAADGYAGFVLLIALGIAEVRHYYGYAVGAGALQCVYIEYQLHEFVVGVKADGLHQINILIAHAFIYAHECVAFGKYQRGIVSHWASKVIAHFFDKFGAGAAAEDSYLFVASKSKHYALTPLCKIPLYYSKILCLKQGGDCLFCHRKSLP